MVVAVFLSLNIIKWFSLILSLGANSCRITTSFSPLLVTSLSPPPFSQHRYDELRKAEKNHKSLSVEQKRDKYLQASEQILAPVVSAVVPVFPAKTWDDISAEFFTSFWSLTLSDLRVPSESYEKEVKRLKQQVTQLTDNRELVSEGRRGGDGMGLGYRMG